MLEIKDLTITYGRNTVIKELNLTVPKGDVLAVIGESGAGKTTLALSLMGLCPGNVEGQIIYQGVDFLSLPEPQRRLLRWNKVSMVFQDLNRSFNPVMTVLEQIMEPMLEHELLSRKEAQKKAYYLLNKVGLAPVKGQMYPHQLSGGEKQRALIAMALTNDPEVLILDEPTAALDGLTKAKICELLKEVFSEKTVVLVTHDLSTAYQLANRVAVLYQGRIMELGLTKDILKNPRHPYTRGLVRSFPTLDATKDLQGIPGFGIEKQEGCVFANICTQRIADCTKIIPKLEKRGEREIACLRGGVVNLLKVEDLTKVYSGVTALKGVSLDIEEGETVAVVGESGSGKTTLALCLMGLEKANQGSIYFQGEKIVKWNKEFYQKVQMIFQNPQDCISHRLNVLETVCEPLVIQKLGTPEERIHKAKKALRDVELPDEDEFLNRYAHHLSGGELQRLAIARALVLEPKLLIADEPTSALDASIQAKIMRLIMDLQEKRGLSILFITHDLALARKVSDRVFVLKDGQVVERGLSTQIFSLPQHPYTRKLLQATANFSDF